MAKQLHRRQFLQYISLSTIALLPYTQVLSQLVRRGGDQLPRFIDAAYRLLDADSLLNLEFYFIHVEQEVSRLKILGGPNSPQESYMIVRLPQQHIAEEYFYEKGEAPDPCATSPIAKACNHEFYPPDCNDAALTTIHATTRIAGYSYLAFRIFPDRIVIPKDSPGWIPSTLPLTPEQLLDWNAPHFELVVRRYINQPIFEINQLGKPIRAADLTSSHWNQPDAENHYPLGYRTENNWLQYDMNNFPKFRASGPHATIKDPSPLTAIEAPYGLILSPELPDQHQYRFRWTFSVPRSEGGTPLWMATLSAEKIPAAERMATQKSERKPFAQSEIRETHLDAGDDLLRLMIVGAPDHILNRSEEADKISSWYHKDQCFLDKYLPESFDRRRLVDLYIRFKLMARTPKIAFTPLGVSVDIELKNHEYDKNGINLYEWKQLISLGRDQEVKVAEVVVDACFGLKMLYIKTTRRKTVCGVSLLDYKTYLMPLETQKDYFLFNNEENITNYATTNYKSNTPFKKIQFATTKPKLVRPLQQLHRADIVVKQNTAACEQKIENTLAFWAKTEEDKYLEWEFIGTDWHDRETKFKKKLFILTSNITLDGEKKVPTPVLLPTFDLTALQGIPVASFSTLEKLELKINEVIQEGAKDAEKWAEIYSKSEELALHQIQLYRDYMESRLLALENELKSAAGLVEDEAVEAFRKLKDRLFQERSAVLASLNTEMTALQARAKTIYDRVMSDVIAPGDALETHKRELRRLLSSVLNESATLQAYVVTRLRALETFLRGHPYAPLLGPLITEIEAVQKVLFDAETDLQTFFAALPQTLRDAVRSQFEAPLREIARISTYIELGERHCRSTIELYKGKVGYAVYTVEEELNDLKQKLQKELNEKWEPAYEQLRTHYNELNRQVSELETEYLLFRNNVRITIDATKQKYFDFYNQYACFPQLHSAKVYIKSVNELVHKAVPMKIRYAEDYVKNQIDDLKLNVRHNAARVFAEVHSEAKESLKGAMRAIGHELGGIVNPELAADFLTYLKNPSSTASQVVQGIKEELEGELGEIKNRMNNIEQELKAELDTLKNGLREKGLQLKEEVLGEFEARYKEGRNQLLLITRDAKQQYEKARQQFNEQRRQLQQQIDDVRQGLESDAKAFFKGLEAKILGSIRLQDILGVDFDPPKLDRDKKSLYYRFVTDDLKNVELGPFRFMAKKQETKLICFFEKPLRSGKSYTAWTRLERFRVSIFDDRLIISFADLQLLSNEHTKNKVTVNIEDVKFQKELAFLESLSKNIQIPGTGIFLNITPRGINASFAYTIPGVSGGAFTFNNLKFMVGVDVPFPTGGNGLSPLKATFGINGPEDKFVVAAGIFGGRGHFIIKTTPKYIDTIDCSIEFGGYIGLDLVIAKGEAFLMAGIRYVFKRDDMGRSSMELYAYLTCGGSVTAFGFITVSVVFILCLRYQQYNGASSLYGTASVSYSIKIGFFKKSFTLTFSKRLMGSDAQPSYTTATRAKKTFYYAGYEEPTALPEATYTHYDEAPDEWRKKVRKERVFTGQGWIRFCQSYNFNV